MLLLALLLMQGPTPETAATIFPGGALVSYNSIFNARDSRPHEGIVTVAAGFRRDFQFTAELPIVTARRSDMTRTAVSESLVTLKYRAVRRDSARGTMQLSVAAGPRFASTVTDVPDDLFLNTSFTYTGLFNIKKLVADISTDYFVRNDETESRLWISYRPYQSTGVGAEWWIGPSLSWQHNVIDRGTVLSPGLTTYVSPIAGTIFWAGIDYPERQKRVSLGMTRQFSLPGR